LIGIIFLSEIGKNPGKFPFIREIWVAPTRYWSPDEQAMAAAGALRMGNATSALERDGVVSPRKTGAGAARRWLDAGVAVAFKELGDRQWRASLSGVW
jgi:hypothetical protein